jgi:hypothetical protein
MYLRAKHTENGPRTKRLLDPEAVGYALVESARMRCEQLIESGDQRVWLRAVHRDLGLAAHHLSTAFSPEWREQCHAAARDAAVRTGSDAGLLERGLEADQPPVLCGEDRQRALRRMFEEAIAAADASAEAVAESPTRYLRKAHVHSLAAAASLDRRLGDSGALLMQAR